MPNIHASYDPALVVLSQVVAILASYAALDLGARLRAVEGKTRVKWLLGGAGAMGLGIWSMHFIGMLALRLSVPLEYNPWIVLLSMAFAGIASALALFIVSRDTMKLPSLIFGSVLMGGGIVAMHYTGMAAMIMPGNVDYDPLIVAISVLIAVVASAAALWLTFYFRDEAATRKWLRKLGSGIIMGSAITGMHFTAMAAARFMSSHGSETTSVAGLETGVLAVVIATVTITILVIVMMGAFLDRRLRHHSVLLSESERQYQSLFDNNTDAVFSFDSVGRIMSVNPAASVITGLDASELLGQTLGEIGLLQDPESVKQKFVEALKGKSLKFETTLYRKDGELAELSVTTVTISGGARSIGVYAICQDITERKRIERRIHYIAYHDDLTGLPNRRWFLESLQTRVNAASGGGECFALMVIDIDQFKTINNAIGQVMGDRLLKWVAEHLLEIIPPGTLIARLGSDEFGLLTPFTSSPEAATTEAEILFSKLQQTVVLEGRDIHLDFSIGCTIAPRDGANHDVLLQNADIALSYAKILGKHHLQVYIEEMQNRATERINIENGLRRALENKEFELYYQPLFDMDSKVIGAEALLRWHHPERGMVSPGVFIPVAEESGLIKQIGDWVLKEACKQAKRWQRAGLESCAISVNLSMRQFEQHDLAQTIARLLKESELDPSLLDIEITESMAMNVDRALGILVDLKEQGVDISMDDFGTGYSSLSYLHLFPINRLKIDQSFVREIREQGSGAPIVETIIAMAHHLNLKVIAEGVETQTQFDFLKSKGCDQVQGFLLARPMPADDFLAFTKHR